MMQTWQQFCPGFTARPLSMIDKDARGIVVMVAGVLAVLHGAALGNGTRWSNILFAASNF